MTWLMPIAVRSHRPSSRRSCDTPELYHAFDMEPDVAVKPREVMPQGARTLPAAYYTDTTYFRREMERLRGPA